VLWCGFLGPIFSHCRALRDASLVSLVRFNPAQNPHDPAPKRTEFFNGTVKPGHYPRSRALSGKLAIELRRVGSPIYFGRPRCRG
jgi:hypothetical protein